MGLLKRLLNIDGLLWSFFVVCVSCFFYLIFSCQYWHQFQDDLNITGPFLSTVLLGGTSAVLKCNGYVLLCVCGQVSCVVKKCGWFKCVLFVLFACVFSYFFVTVGLDFLLLFGWNLTKKHLVDHMEKNIIHIRDPKLQVERDHGGSLFLRYQGEDVELQSGSDVIIWKSDGPPTDDELMNMTWRRNEKPITWSDRHSYNVTWTEPVSYTHLTLPTS